MENQLIKYGSFLLFCMLLITACEDSKDEVQSPLQLISILPAEGAKVIPGTVEVTFEFDQPVTIHDTSKITLNGVAVENVYAVARYIKAKVDIRQTTTNDFTIEPGAIAVFSTNQVNENTYSTQFSALSYNSHKSIEAERLLQYMEQNTGLKMLTGVSACINWNINEALWVYKHTGKYPAINGFDYIHDVYSTPGGWIDYSDITPAQSWAGNNGIVAAMWHWGQETNDGTTTTCTPGSGSDETGFKPSAIYDPESEGYKKMIAEIDRVAGWMKPLAGLRIPILWRPLHEAQGNWTEDSDGAGWRTSWFWWGVDGPEVFVDLWKAMYDRMVNYHGLTNLIWVYNTGDSMLWYPGDEYVDVVGYDFYDQNMEYLTYWYNFMRTNFPGKPVAITECGTIPKISEQWAAGLHWNYFMPWWDNLRTEDPTSAAFESTDHNNFNIEFWNDAFECDFIVTREQLPSFRD